MNPYKRILLKLSGESLSGSGDRGISPEVLANIANEIKQLVSYNFQVGIVLGAGNLFRGTVLSDIGIDRITGDQMGMLATVINGLALRDALQDLKMPTYLMSSIEIAGISPIYDRRLAMRHLEDNNIVIFTGGIGNPFFTTDTTACLRGIEINADIILKATKVDFVYDKDPMEYADATPYKTITYNEVIEKNLKVMDITAICLARDHQKKIKVFNIFKEGALLRAVMSEDGEGTLIQA